MTVKVRDHGYNAFMKRVAKASKAGKALKLTVGIHEEEGSAPEGDGGATVAQVMGFHEFGLGVPQRSWLRAWFDENESANQDRMRKLGAAVLTGKLDGPEQALQRLGLFAVGSIQQRMAAGISPESLVDGRQINLIDTGQGRSAITFKVVAK